MLKTNYVPAGETVRTLFKVIFWSYVIKSNRTKSSLIQFFYICDVKHHLSLAQSTWRDPKSITRNSRKNNIRLAIKEINYERSLLSTSVASSSGSEFLIPHPAVFKDKETGRRPKLMPNDRFKARGWSSFKNISCIALKSCNR